ncbi:hypothetical protein [Parasediminibacterium sp. JCM 36343]|uniref:hypothetical protein n=1 Tax=Parasediminibacterium sp. JCM 36343 TaxID=3374279 RepID=UPI00397A18D3
MDSLGGLYNFLADFFLIFGKYAVIFWQIAGVLFAVLLAKDCWPATGTINEKKTNRNYLLLSCFCILVMRLPTLIANELNPDESEWMAGAMTLVANPRFWGSVDGTTSGPLNIYPLCLLPLVGLKITYASVRLFAVLFIYFPVFLLLFHAIKTLFNSYVAKMALMPFTLFIAFIVHYDLNAYNSEQVPLLLLSTALYLATQLYKKESLALYFLLGFVFGILPFSKLQTVPMGGVIGLFSLYIILKSFSINKKYAFFKIGSMLFGILIPFFIVGFYLWSSNLTYDFIQSYIINNLAYAHGQGFLKLWLGLPAMIWIHTKAAIPFYASTCIIGIACIIIIVKSRKAIPDKSKPFLLLSLALFVTAWYSIGKPGTGFPHYQYFIVIPIIFLLGVFMGIANETNSNDVGQGKAFKSFVGISFFASLLLLYSGNKWLSTLYKDGKMVHENPVSIEVKKHVKEGDKIVVWGSMENKWGSQNKFYVETNTIQGTRESHSQRQEGYIGKEQHQYYLDRYIADMEANKPKVIIDVTGSRAYCNSFKAFCNLLDEKYFVDTEINLEGKDNIVPCKIYLKKQGQQ